MHEAGGFHGVNRQVKAALRDWLAETGRELLRTAEAEEGTGALGLQFGLAQLLKNQAKYDEAKPLWEEALASRKETLGDRHPSTLTSMSSLGSLLQAQGKLDEAEPLSKEAAILYREVLGDDHPHTRISVNSYKELLKRRGKYGEAERF